MESISEPGQSSLASGKYIRMWTWIWCVLAVLHVTQSIWTSAGRAYPGDLGDGRFNQLILEHGYQSLRGVARWDSPRQFYPATGTLAYSDTHAGTLAIYAEARFLGISREEAWQVWFVVVVALNAWAALRFFRAFEVHPWLRGPVVFASAGSAIFVWVACTHMQMLPVFPALFASEQLLRWRSDRRGSRIVAAAGWLGWQFAASPYLGFFAAVVLGLVGLAYVVVGGSGKKPGDPSSEARGRSDRLLAAFIFVVGAGLAAVTAKIYVSAVRTGVSRPMSDVLIAAPQWSSWLQAPPTREFPSPLRAPGNINPTEHCWFVGWIASALLLTAIFSGWRNRSAPARRWSLALAIVAGVTPALFTAWTATGDSAWIWIARHVEVLRAFRAAGRVAVPLQFAAIGAAALLLSHWLQRAKSRTARIGVILIACAMALENFSPRQRFTLTATARARTQAMIAAWKAAGDRPVLVYAPGPPPADENSSFCHLDAWSAALQLRRATVNGYSGGAPASHVGFMSEPTPDNARALLRAVGLSENDVSFVDRPIEWTTQTAGRSK
jgi:hypothetical protein